MKKGYIPCQKLSNNTWHTTFMQVNQGNFLLLVGGSQINILTFGPSFGHNLCFKYSNGLCKSILDIYISIYFQWYKYFNSMGFDS